MKKILFGVFAHPDDEAFGPAGALLTEAAAGTEVHLILLTAGEAGRNPDKVADLAQVRLEEWRAAGQLLGCKSQKFLGYHDGQLNNQDLESIGQQIIDYALQAVDDTADSIELMSTDLNGITGHIDHIVAARAASLAFYKLKATDARFTKLRLACVPRQQRPTANTDWIFAEPGRNDDEIDQTVDARHHHDEIIAIMKTHHTQRQDFQNHVDKLHDGIGMNYFIVKT